MNFLVQIRFDWTGFDLQDCIWCVCFRRHLLVCCGLHVFAAGLNFTVHFHIKMVGLLVVTLYERTQKEGIRENDKDSLEMCSSGFYWILSFITLLNIEICLRRFQ